MNAGSIIFMALSWGFVLGLLGWSYNRILRKGGHFDPDGIGPGLPPQAGTYDSGARPPG